jgi:hypothetical protein
MTAVAKPVIAPTPQAPANQSISTITLHHPSYSPEAKMTMYAAMVDGVKRPAVFWDDNRSARRVDPELLSFIERAILAISNVVPDLGNVTLTRDDAVPAELDAFILVWVEATAPTDMTTMGRIESSFYRMFRALVPRDRRGGIEVLLRFR